MYKNIDKQTKLTLKELVEYQEGQVVSKTLVQNDYVSMTIFSFDKGEEISTHAAGGDAMVTVLEGKGRFTVGGEVFYVEEGYFSLTTAGEVAVIILIAVLVILTAVISTRVKENKDQKKSPFSTKQLVFSAVALALGFVTSYIKIVNMPWGGSITLCSMLFVTMIGYWYGPKVGLTAAFAFSLLQFVQDGGSYILSPLQACLDYIFAFAALGLSGFFNKQKQ